MKAIFTFLFLMAAVLVHAQLSDRQVNGLKSGRIADDTSYVYALPYEKGKAVLFIQGANSKIMSHKNELAYDFKMKTGSKVCAARSGIVVNLRSDSDKGGLKQENLSDGNYIIIMHEDGSKAYYWHLQYDRVFVKMGSRVEQGDVIGLSGNTGYSAFPHLHFQVVDANDNQILVRFKTKKSILYLKPGNLYKRPA